MNMHSIARISKATMVGVLLIGLTSTAGAAPKSDLWDFWSPAATEASQTVDHSAWNLILGNYLSVEDDINNFDYGSLAENQADHQSLKSRYPRRRVHRGPMVTQARNRSGSKTHTKRHGASHSAPDIQRPAHSLRG